MRCGRAPIARRSGDGNGEWARARARVTVRGAAQCGDAAQREHPLAHGRAAAIDRRHVGHFTKPRRAKQQSRARCSRFIASPFINATREPSATVAKISAKCGSVETKIIERKCECAIGAERIKTIEFVSKPDLSAGEKSTFLAEIRVCNTKSAKNGDEPSSL